MWGPHRVMAGLMTLMVVSGCCIPGSLDWGGPSPQGATGSLAGEPGSVLGRRLLGVAASPLSSWFSEPRPSWALWVPLCTAPVFLPLCTAPESPPLCTAPVFAPLCTAPGFSPSVALLCFPLCVPLLCFPLCISLLCSALCVPLLLFLLLCFLHRSCVPSVYRSCFCRSCFSSLLRCFPSLSPPLRVAL
jgi:hypothetical protein